MIMHMVRWLDDSVRDQVHEAWIMRRKQVETVLKPVNPPPQTPIVRQRNRQKRSVSRKLINAISVK